MAASVFGRSLSGHGRLTLFRTPAPGARSLDERNPAISTSAEQRFKCPSPQKTTVIPTTYPSFCGALPSVILRSRRRRRICFTASSLRGAQRRSNLNKTLLAPPLPVILNGVKNLFLPETFASNSQFSFFLYFAEQTFRLFEWLQLTLRDDIFCVRAAKAVPERLHGELLHHDPTSVPLQFGRGTEIGMKKVAGMFGLLNKPIYICSTD